MLSFPGGTEMFQFPPCPPPGLCIQPAVTGYCPAGFPHSETHGSTPDDGSPWLFAAIRVLLRLLTPRHPPYALSSLIYVRWQSLIRLAILPFRSVVKVLTVTPLLGLPAMDHWTLPPSRLGFSGQLSICSFSSVHAVSRHKTARLITGHVRANRMISQLPLFD